MNIFRCWWRWWCRDVKSPHTSKIDINLSLCQAFDSSYFSHAKRRLTPKHSSATPFHHHHHSIEWLTGLRDSFGRKLKNHDWLNCDIEYTEKLIPFGILDLYNALLKVILLHEWRSIHCWWLYSCNWKLAKKQHKAIQSKSFKIINNDLGSGLFFVK